MFAPVPQAAIGAWRQGMQVFGKPVDYFESGNATGRSVRARVVYLSAQELANSIESYPIRVTVDARDFTARAPLKGDTVVIDDARRGVMSVAETHLGDTLIAYRLGVQG